MLNQICRQLYFSQLRGKFHLFHLNGTQDLTTILSAYQVSSPVSLIKHFQSNTDWYFPSPHSQKEKMCRNEKLQKGHSPESEHIRLDACTEDVKVPLQSSWLCTDSFSLLDYRWTSMLVFLHPYASAQRVIVPNPRWQPGFSSYLSDNTILFIQSHYNKWDLQYSWLNIYFGLIIPHVSKWMWTNCWNH